jgi:hypothetical protein
MSKWVLELSRKVLVNVKEALQQQQVLSRKGKKHQSQNQLEDQHLKQAVL